MSERDARVYEDGSSSLSPRYPRVMSSSSLSSTISGGGGPFSNGSEEERREQQLTLGRRVTIHGGKKPKNE